MDLEVKREIEKWVIVLMFAQRYKPHCSYKYDNVISTTYL